MMQTGTNRSGALARVALAAVMIIAVGGATIAYRVMRADARPDYPTPRIDANAERVLPEDSMAEVTHRYAHFMHDYAAPADVARAYEVARQMPELLDGLYCWCDCSHHHGHRSLLSCFESEHGSGCWICVREAIVAAELHEKGMSLDQIRATIDAMVRDRTLRG